MSKPSKRQTMDDFKEQQWKPPEKEDRDLRTNFYGPLTDEMLKRSLAGNNEDDIIPPSTQNSPSGNIIKEKQRSIQSLNLNDYEHCEYFISWQEKKCKPLPRIKPASDDNQSMRSRQSTKSSSTQHHSTMSVMGSPSLASHGTTSTRISSNDSVFGSVSVHTRLICFPWEGGNPTIFEKLSSQVPAAFCLGVIYPGRLNRCRQTMVDIRESAQEVACALQAQGYVDMSFSFVGHGLGAVFAYEVAMFLRQHFNKQPDLFFAIQAPGPQSFVDDEDFENEDDSESEGQSMNDQHHLWDEDDDFLYEYVMTLERGAIYEKADNRSLFGLGLTPFRADLRAMASFRYKSDWPLARPLHLVIAHYDGRISRDALRTWERETTKKLLVHEMCCDVRSMLREDAVVAEFGEWLNDRIVEELEREKDPNEDSLDALARGVE